MSRQYSVSSLGLHSIFIRWFPLLFLIAGIMCMAIALWIGYQQSQFKQRASTTEGLVVRLIEDDGSKAPVVRFRLPNGEDVTFQSNYFSKPPRYSVEEKVIVRYDPEKPEHAAIVGWMEEWFATSLVGGIGVLFSIIGIALKRAFRWLLGN